MDSATRLLNNWDLVNRDLLLVSSCIIVHVRLASLERFHDQSQYGRRCVPVLSALELCIKGSSRFNPGRGDCFVFLDKTLLTQCLASLSGMNGDR